MPITFDEELEVDEDQDIDGKELKSLLINLYQKGDAIGTLNLLNKVWNKNDKSDTLKHGSGTSRIKTSQDRQSLHRRRKVEKSSWDNLFLWLKPSKCCLDAILDEVSFVGLNKVISVGCGSGLLEWMLQQITGLEVSGIEVNRDWWKSSYAPPTFIEHIYVEESDDPPTISSSHALMFCYFNGADLFRKYLSRYEGSLVILIGSEGGDQHTEPKPLDLIGVDKWKLRTTHRVSGNDIIAFYTRKIILA